MAVGVLAFGSSLVFAAYLPPSRHFRPHSSRPADLLASFGRHLKNGRLLALYAEGFLLLGAYIALYNYIGYRLLAPPYDFSQTAVGLIFGMSLVGIGSAAFVGDLGSRIGRPRVFLVLVLLFIGGALASLSGTLWVILGGMLLATFAFYGAHTIASAWVGVEAKRARAQASSLYLFAYYTGSSLVGWAGGIGWERQGWPGVVAVCLAVLVPALVLAVCLAWGAPGPAALSRAGDPPRGVEP